MLDDGSRFEDAGHGPRITPLDTFSAACLADLPVPNRRWLVPDLVPDRAVTMLSGDGGVGKSLLALQLAVAVVTGTDWVGLLPERGPVLYLSAEDEKDEVHRRLSDILASRGLDFVDVPDLHIATLAGKSAVLAAPDGRSGALAPTPLWYSVAAKVAALRPLLMIADNLADVFGGNEISRPEVRQFVGMLRGAAIKAEMAVLLVAHPSLAGIASGSGLSGSTAWNNSVRSRLYLDRPKIDRDEPDPDLRVMRQLKANYAASGGEIKLRWMRGAFRLEGLVNGGSTFDRAGAEAGAERAFLALLDRLAGHGRNVSHSPCSTYAPKVFSHEPDNGGFSKRAFERAMTALFQSGDIKLEKFGPPSKQRSRLARS